MITVIKDVEVYSPKYLGEKQVVILNDRIEGIYDEITIPKDFLKVTEIDGKGKVMFPGFIDCHVHIIGGGGEGGFSTRTGEISLETLVEAGITTVIGCLGTDDVCRNSKTLIAKAKQLEEQGITAYCYTGSYSVPVRTITDTIKEDVMLLDKVIGVGEIALSDHRSSQPTFDELALIAAEARVGGLLSNKAGLTHIHLGTGARRMNMLFDIVNKTEIPAKSIFPTHINRNDELFYSGMEYMKMGGYIDLTTSTDPLNLEPGEVIASKGLKKVYELYGDTNRITFSSDGQGSMPLFNEKKELINVGICSVKSLYEEVRKAILIEEVPIEKAIQVITSNVAELFNFNKKGRIEEGRDADFVLVNNSDLNIEMVFARGKRFA